MIQFLIHNYSCPSQVPVSIEAEGVVRVVEVEIAVLVLYHPQWNGDHLLYFKLPLL